MNSSWTTSVRETVSYHLSATVGILDDVIFSSTVSKFSLLRFWMNQNHLMKRELKAERHRRVPNCSVEVILIKAF